MIYGTSATVFKDSTSVKFEVEGSKGSKTIELSTGQTLEDLNKELEEIGIQASIVGKNQAVTYNGINVTRSSGGNDSVLRSPSSALYFVGADGVDINSVKITPYKGTTAQDVNAKGISNAGTSASGFTLTRVQNRAEETAENSGPANSLTFFIGGEPNFGMEVTINKMDFKSLLGMSADAFAEKFLTREGAESALTTIDNALNKALNEQTKLGAIENRLGYASDNLTTMNTNTEESDSVLRDADIAKDMVQYAKYSVLSQIAQAMLAQANNAASGALSFLQQ
jgi:flagellin